jgi:hypothetical protein
MVGAATEAVRMDTPVANKGKREVVGEGKQKPMDGDGRGGTTDGIPPMGGILEVKLRLIASASL